MGNFVEVDIVTEDILVVGILKVGILMEVPVFVDYVSLVAVRSPIMECFVGVMTFV